MKSQQLANALVISIASVIILIYLQSIIVPFVFAIIVWLLMRELKNAAARIPKFKDWVPNWLQNLLAFVVIFGVIFFFGKLLANNVEAIMDAAPGYQKNIQVVIDEANETFGIDVMEELEEYTQTLDIAGLTREVFNSLSTVLSDVFLVILYVLFLMLEEGIIPRKLKNSYSQEEKYQEAKGILDDINQSVSRYISLKTLVSIITGILSYVVLLIIGVDFPMFWAILIFLLNYIPTIGSLIATVFPALMALLQFGTLTPFILVLSLVGSIQVVMGNLVEPKLMGDSLNISSLVVLLALAFWGVIWGIVGMILSVPITVMLIIIFSRFPSTRGIAVWLSATGKVD